MTLLRSSHSRDAGGEAATMACATRSEVCPKAHARDGAKSGICLTEQRAPEDSSKMVTSTSRCSMAYLMGVRPYRSTALTSAL